MSELVATDNNFQSEVLDSELPVLVDFWAEWCGPCRMIGPMVAQLAEEYAGKVKVAKLNVDEQEETAGKYGITSIPTIAIFKNGEIAAQQIGAVPKDKLVEMIESIL